MNGWQYNRHMTHLLTLVVAGRLRNAWSEDDELQAMVLSSIPSKFLESPPLTSSSLYTEFINDWTFWWHSSFKTAYDQLEGDFDHLISKFTHGVGTTSFGSIDCFLKRFQEYYTQCSQSRDPSSAESMDPSPLTITPEMSAVAFVAGSRALGLETRLVASLHPIPLSFSQKGKKSSNTKSKPKSSSSTSSSSSSSSSLATSPAPASSHTSASSSSILIPIASSLSSSSHVALGPYPLVFWAEIYSPIENRWIPVCPVRNLIDNISAMEPKPGVMIQLQYSYIIAFTSHFAIKDVTTRYSTTFSATVAKNRLASTGYRRDDIKCWDTLLWLFSSSSSKTDQEREEDEELQGRVVKESMPSTFAGFNNHPLFALERHLKKFELIHPNDKDSAVGVFKKELVFPRKNVHTLQNRMTWLKNHCKG